MRANTANDRSTSLNEWGPLIALGEPGSDVFRARASDGGRFMALRLWCGLSGDELRTARERVQLASRVSHPMLAEVSGCEERGNAALWIVSEYVPGPTLETWSRAGRMLPLASAIDLVRRLSLALQTALKHGISHHAINPRKLVVFRQDPRGGERLDAKLLDLGVAAWMRPELPRLAQAHFMAPESLAAVLADRDPTDTIDAHANVYSCGALLYYLTTGTLPFANSELSTLMAAQSTGELVAPRSLNPEICEALQCVMLAALAVQPTSRYANPGEFASALAAVELRHRAVDQRTSAVPVAALPCIDRHSAASDLAAASDDADDTSLTWRTADEERPSIPDGALFGKRSATPRRRWLALLSLGAGLSSYWAVSALTLPATHSHALRSTAHTVSLLAHTTPARSAKATDPLPAAPLQPSQPTAAITDAHETAARPTARAKPAESTLAPHPRPSPREARAAEPMLAAPVPHDERTNVVAMLPTALAPVVASEPLPIAVRFNKLSVRGSMTPSAVRRALDRIRDELTTCYESISKLGQRPLDVDPIPFELTIDEVGRAREPHILGQHPAGFETCLLRAAGKLSAAPPDTGTVQVAFNLRGMP